MKTLLSFFPSRARRRRTAALVASIAVAASLVTAAAAVLPSAAPSAQAATTSSAAAATAGFDAGEIIDDSTFYNTSTMTAGEIQSFLSSKVLTCRAGAVCLKDFHQATSSKAADRYCAAYTGRSNETAASIIARVAAACGINPQVLIVTLQKEQGLVLSTGPSATAYKIALGFGCPDTAACDTRYYGFFNQLYTAARQFQVYAKNPMSFRYRAGVTNMIQYNPSAACGTKAVYIQNSATAALYNYTPYTPNAAALAAGYGSATCGAYGNRNFYLYFRDFFGSPSNWLASPSFEGPAMLGWAPSNGTVNRAVIRGTAENGAYYLATNTAVAGRTMAQTVTRKTKAGEQATASVWVRATVAGFKGNLVLRGLGGTTESTSVAFTAGPTAWTQVSVALPFAYAGHTQTRLEVQLVTTTATLQVDDTELSFGAAPPRQNLLNNASFDSGIAPWDGGNGAMNKTTYSDKRFMRNGTPFGAANTLVAGRSIAQSVAVPASPNKQYTFSIWVRSSASAQSFSGKLALWALDGSSNRASTQTFTVGQTWTKLSTTVNTGTTGATRLKAEIYLGTLGPTLFIDDASLSANVLTGGSFEGTTAGWTANPGVALASARAAVVPDGSSFLSTTSSKAGVSFYQDVASTPPTGSTWTASIWVRSGSAVPARGRLALWSFGGTARAAAQTFTTTGTWTRVQVSIPITTTDVSGLRVEVYEDTAAVPMQVDSAQLY